MGRDHRRTPRKQTLPPVGLESKGPGALNLGLLSSLILGGRWDLPSLSKLCLQPVASPGYLRVCVWCGTLLKNAKLSAQPASPGLVPDLADCPLLCVFDGLC